MALSPVCNTLNSRIREFVVSFFDVTNRLYDADYISSCIRMFSIYEKKFCKQFLKYHCFNSQVSNKEQDGINEQSGRIYYLSHEKT